MLHLPGGVVPHIGRFTDEEMEEPAAHNDPKALFQRAAAGELSERAIARSRAALLLEAVRADRVDMLAKLISPKKRLPLEQFSALTDAAAASPDCAAWLLAYRREHYSAQDFADYETHQADLELGFTEPTASELRKILLMRYAAGGVCISGYKAAQKSYEIPARIGEKDVIAVNAAAFYPLDPLPRMTRRFPEEASALPDLRSAASGDVLFFGRCASKRSAAEQPIAWRVVQAEADRLLVLSEAPVALLPFESESREVTWETCRLRRWLNEVFFPLSFTRKERERILPTAVATPDNTQFGTPCGSDTNDRLFLLSAEEADLLPNDAARAIGLWWWLRTSGFDNTFAVTVTPDGRVVRLGTFVDAEDYAVRPAMWLSR